MYTSGDLLRHTTHTNVCTQNAIGSNKGIWYFVYNAGKIQGRQNKRGR